MSSVEKSEFHFFKITYILYHLNAYIFKGRTIHIECILDYKLNEILSHDRTLIKNWVFLLDRLLKSGYIWDRRDTIDHGIYKFYILSDPFSQMWIECINKSKERCSCYFAIFLDVIAAHDCKFGSRMLYLSSFHSLCEYSEHRARLSTILEIVLYFWILKVEGLARVIYIVASFSDSHADDLGVRTC